MYNIMLVTGLQHADHKIVKIHKYGVLYLLNLLFGKINGGNKLLSSLNLNE